MTAKKEKNKKLNISQSQELGVLRKIVEITNAQPDLPKILSEVVGVMTEATKADSVFIYLFDEKKQNLVLMASKTPHSRELGKIHLRAGEGITGWVARENKPVAIKENAYQDKRFKGFDVLPEDRYEAFLSVPIIYNNEAIGVVNIQHKKAHEYTPATIGMITLIAKQISGVIEHARLFQDIKQKALQFDSLVKVSQSITSENYIDEILNLIVVVTAEMLNSKICSIMLLDEKHDELVIKASQSLSLEYKNKPNVKAHGSVAGEAMKAKKPVTVDDVRTEQKYGFRDLAIREGLTSMLSVPMVVKDHSIGVVNVYTKEPHTFTREEINVLQMVANQAAIAVENTHLMQEALNAKEALETRKLVERAKGVLMRLSGLSEEEAHKMIHKKSMDSCRSMKEIAESILLMDEFQKKK
ncbi:MAG TPA: GAF and ANTAR domain-containing protein [Candidatus Omnitrophota bacterium]|nr:GAF and ANTAR domain-containing protein [Candidatus Omnitrophota bacterium]